MHGRHGEPMDRDDEGVIEAARAIRPYLNDLVGPADAALVDRRIVSEFAAGVGQVGAAGRLRAVLEEYEDTAWFLRRVLGDKPHYRPPYFQPVHQRSITRPSGDPGYVAADRYACPRGDYVWYRPDVGTPIPECPNHHIKLTRT